MVSADKNEFAGEGILSRAPDANMEERDGVLWGLDLDRLHMGCPAWVN